MNKSKDKTDPRFPYTYACDLIRAIPDVTSNGLKLSRSEASRIRSTISKILGMDDGDVAEKLAKYYLENGDEFNNIKELIREIFGITGG